MTHEQATAKYPALMAYIAERNQLATANEWCSQLRIDESAACAGELADVAEQMKQARADYGSYPYNSAMGEFLGLPLKGNHEPEHGYYMASGVLSHYALGVAQRRAKELIAEGRQVRLVLAKDKKTRQPIRFATFNGPEQIQIEGHGYLLCDGKRKVRLSSNWSVETAIARLVEYLETGEPIAA